MTEAKTEDKDSKADYDSVMRRSAQGERLTQHHLLKRVWENARIEGILEIHNEEKSHKSKEFVATPEYVKSLHVETQSVVSRVGEMVSLDEAKVAFSGAD